MMIDIRNLPNAWEMIDRLGGEEAKEKDELYDIYYRISTVLFDYRLKHGLSQKNWRISWVLLKLWWLKWRVVTIIIRLNNSGRLLINWVSDLASTFRR